MELKFSRRVFPAAGSIPISTDSDHPRRRLLCCFTTFGLFTLFWLLSPLYVSALTPMPCSPFRFMWHEKFHLGLHAHAIQSPVPTTSRNSGVSVSSRHRAWGWVCRGGVWRRDRTSRGRGRRRRRLLLLLVLLLPLLLLLLLLLLLPLLLRPLPLALPLALPLPLAALLIANFRSNHATSTATTSPSSGWPRLQGQCQLYHGCQVPAPCLNQ